MVALRVGGRFAEGSKALEVGARAAGAARSADEGADTSMVLYRFGKGPETAEELAAEARNARAVGFPHGVSTRSHLPSGFAASGEYRQATVRELEGAGFKVHKTGRSKTHYTVELPDPVTNVVADEFNRIFKAP